MRIIFIAVSTILAAIAQARAAEPLLERQFNQTVQPFVQTYCVSCHGGEKPKGDFDISRFTSLDSVQKDQQHWGLVLERIRDEEMPPAKAKKFPSAAERKQVIDWIVAVRDVEVKRNAGDPGTVL